MIHVLGNLACELEWRGESPSALPARVSARIAALATLLRALVDGDTPVTIWTDGAVEPSRIPEVTGLPRATFSVGAPPAGTTALAWGASHRLAGTIHPPAEALLPAIRALLPAPTPPVEVARIANDRRTALALARRLGADVTAVAVAMSPDDAAF